MIALIDADILVYRVGYTTEDVNTDIAAYRMEESIKGIMEALKTDECLHYLTSTDHSNYRYELYPDYKANRKQPKPKHYDFLRSYLVEERGATVVFGMEADDRLGIEQSERTVICSIDKDLDQIPGKHFNFVKGLLYDVTPVEGLRCFYRQLLTGDATDNIPGIYGIGPKKSEAILNGFTEEVDLWNAVYKTWLTWWTDNEEKKDEDLLEILTRNGRLLKIKQSKDEPLWTPPNV